MVELSGIENLLDAFVSYEDHSSNQVDFILVLGENSSGHRVQHLTIDPRNPKEFQLLSHKQIVGIPGLVSVFGSSTLSDPVLFSQGTWPEDPQIDPARKAEMLANRQLPALFSLSQPDKPWTFPNISQIFGVTLVPGQENQVSAN